MSDEDVVFLAVLKASYDYEPQSDDEIAIKEGDILFLIERTDEDWWKVKVKGNTQEEQTPLGLVPAAYVEQAVHTSVVKAVYDYEATSSGELSISEGDSLLGFDLDGEWLLVQASQEEKAGYVPANYVETNEDEDANDTEPTPQIIVPPSPPPPVSAYVDPEERVASAKVNADDIKTWPLSEIDRKGKKLKGTLGIGNGSIFFASESSKDAVRKWLTVDISNISTDKKQLSFDVGGPNPASLKFSAGSKDEVAAIVEKLEASKAASSHAPASHAEDEDLPSAQAQKSTKKASVHFSSSSPDIIPSSPSTTHDDDLDLNEQGNQATALYDFNADGDDELSVTEGEHLVVIEQSDNEWWKCRNRKGQEGMVPASYVELPAASNLTTPLASSSARSRDTDNQREAEAKKIEAERAAAEREKAAELEELNRRQAEEQRRQDEEQRRQDEEHKERERLKKQEARLRAQAAETERIKRQEAAAAAKAAQRAEAASPKPASPPTETKKATKDAGPSRQDNGRPPSDRVRIWHDRTGQFRVDAAFLGFKDGKLRLHKTNGVIVEVPSEKMSLDDLRYVEKLTRRHKPHRMDSEDDVPLAVQHPAAVNGKSRQSNQAQSQVKKRPAVDWFEFFLNAGCDVDDCTRYASAFEKDKIDESILPDITDATMRSLGLREGDIIRVTKAIASRQPKKGPHSEVEEQIRRDESLARQLDAQEQANIRKSPPQLFSGPGGTLKNIRRGRPQPSKSLPLTTVDLIALDSASTEIERTSSPSTRSPLTPVQAPPRASSAQASTTINGFDDDAWTVKNKPEPATTVNAAPRAPSAPPVSNPTTTTSPLAMKDPPSQPVADKTHPTKTADQDIFDQLARLSELRKATVPGPSPQPVPQPALQPQALTPPVIPQSYHAGLGMGSSPSPMGHLAQAQQAGFVPSPSPSLTNGPRGPFAPVPANQSLLQPLIPTQTGFNGFIPTRSGGAIPPLPPLPPQQPSFLPTQPLMAQPTGLPFQGHNGFNPSPMQTNPTGFNNNWGGPQTVAPVSQPSQNDNPFTNPDNVFAQMKSGTFGNDDLSGPQPAGKYAPLSAPPSFLPLQTTGWAGYQGQYSYR